jgi:outer membrane protein
MKRITTKNAVALTAILSLTTHPAFAAHALTPGTVWIGQAAGAGAGNGIGTGNAAGAAGGNGVGAGNAAGNGVGAGVGTNGVGGAGTTGVGGNGVGAGNNANNGAGTGVGNNGVGMNGNAAGNGTNGNDTTGNGNGVGSSGANGNAGAGTSQSAAGNSGAQGSLPIPGASTAPQIFDLTRTIQAGLQSSADVQVATRNVEIDRKRADAAAAEARPHVNASGQATRFDQKTLIALGSGPAIEVTGTHIEVLQLGVTDNLDLTGQIRAATDQYRLQSLADTFVLGEIRNARILRAQTIYFNTLRAKHQVDVANATLVNAQRQLTDATNLNNAGVGQRIDVLRAQTQVATADQDLATAENNYGVALSSFNDLVGRPLGSPVFLTDAAGVTIAQPVMDFSKVGAPDAKAAPPLPDAPQEVSAINVSSALESANRQRPEILQAQVNVRVAQTGIKLARAGLEPTFSLSAAGNYYPDTNFQFPRKRTAQIGATLNIPLYDGGATRDRVDEARLSTENATTSLESTRSDVALDVRQSYLNLGTAAQQIGAANAALQAAVAARQLAELRYQGQVGLYLEVTDAQSALVQAENNQVNAVYNYLVARAQFQNAIGAPQI